MGDLIDKMGIDPSSLPQFNSGNIGWFLLVGEKSSPVISKGIARINWSTYGTTSFTLIIINDDGKTAYLSQQATALLSGLQVGNSQPFIPEFSSLDTTKKWTLVITTGQSYPHWEVVE